MLQAKIDIELTQQGQSNLVWLKKQAADTETKIKCLVIESEQGIGKTTIVKNALKELNKEVLYINSYTTALAFYKSVYYNRYRQIIL